MAQCSEMHKVCSFVSEHIASQGRIQRTSVATATYTEIFTATDCGHLEGFLKIMGAQILGAISWW
jgi:hypothetical protein